MIYVLPTHFPSTSVTNFMRPPLPGAVLRMSVEGVVVGALGVPAVLAPLSATSRAAAAAAAASAAAASSATLIFSRCADTRRSNAVTSLRLDKLSEEGEEVRVQ